MLEFDKKSNLLMTNRYQYSLQDVAEPNLYRELYDYESIPKVAFNMRHVPENMPDEIWMTDTTFRDGQQSVIATRMRTEDMLPVLEQMDNFGYECIEMWGGGT